MQLYLRQHLANIHTLEPNFSYCTGDSTGSDVANRVFAIFSFCILFHRQVALALCIIAIILSLTVYSPVGHLDRHPSLRHPGQGAVAYIKARLVNQGQTVMTRCPVTFNINNKTFFIIV